MFNWDPRKATSNALKHGVTFEEAVSVFVDHESLLFVDDTHSEYEERYLLLGISSNMNLLMISHKYDEVSNDVRIISARKATTQEAKVYAKRKG